MDDLTGVKRRLEARGLDERAEPIQVGGDGAGLELSGVHLGEPERGNVLQEGEWAGPSSTSRQ
eukprot:1752783-Heterocapsa_arctica.AAC.1